MKTSRYQIGKHVVAGLLSLALAMFPLLGVHAHTNTHHDSQQWHSHPAQSHQALLAGHHDNIDDDIEHGGGAQAIDLDNESTAQSKVKPVKLIPLALLILFICFGLCFRPPLIPRTHTVACVRFEKYRALLRGPPLLA